ncbi:hypothetical protein [Sandarakinorhabdus sp.]|jgi:hypothetical protein|uniref:hypothetical protein n=1 Tax=Sandarakinorhabdus sp. TaxID=1916663 RepID=UPI003341FFC3
MDARRANSPLQAAEPAAWPPAVDDGWTDTPLTDAEWNAMPEAERQAILEAEAELDRGIFVPHEEVMAELRAMKAKFAAKCRS